MSFGYQVLGFGAGSSAAVIEVDYLVVAGGSCGGKRHGGGGGAGGYRTSFPGGTKQSLVSPVTVTVGAGGSHPQTQGATDCQGTNSSIVSGALTFTSEKGGQGVGHGSYTEPYSYMDGGSGGGNGHGTSATAGGSGNTPPTSPSQGNDGGNSGGAGGGGGGGSSTAGTATTDGSGKPGGSSTSNSITGSSVAYAGGGGGGAYQTRGAGSGGGGGATSGVNENNNSAAASANTGSGSGGNGAGGGGPTSEGTIGNGGSGIVVIRVPAANDPGSLAIAPGTNSISTDSPTGDKICTFTVSGTLSF